MAAESISSSLVQLGDVVFDPVETNDFRLSIEGTSNVGKSNTIAVLLEDLAAVRVPTLIVERLGALTPVRFEVEDLIVIGAQDEEGIDLPVPLEDLDQVGKWVLDEGLKILVDISTYADYEEERSRVHLAAATAIQSLNDRAHEKYRKRGRTRSLLVIDEAHWLAPKDNAPDPQMDDWVKRCRGQIIKASTEGGNKGISVITGFQRRAFIHNGAIQLCDDFIAHKPGPEDIDRTADVLRCDPSELASLETGELLARGPAITGGELVGPTKVRRRTSPDPRDETFELPEVSGEVGAFLESIKEDLEAERERRQQRQDELERLRAENERLQDRVDELEQELADTDRLASALENFGTGGGAAARDVGEGVEGLQERVDELREERDALDETNQELRAEAENLRNELDERREHIADLEAEVQELRAAFESSAQAVEQLASTFDVDVELTAVPDQEVGTKDLEPEQEAVPGQSTAVRDQLMSEFQEEAIDRLMSTIEEFSDREQKLLRYIESRGRPMPSQKAWAKATFGLSSDPSGSHYEAMRAVIESGFVRKNNDGSITPSIRERVEEELDGYDVDRTTIGDTHERVLAQLAD